MTPLAIAGVGVGVAALGGAAYAIAQSRWTEIEIEPIPAATGPMVIQAETVIPERMPRPIPDRARVPNRPGLLVWGQGGTWEPGWLKTVGCTDVRWGMCFREYIDGIREHPDAPDSVADVEKWVMRALSTVDPTGTQIAKWIVKNICLLFRFPLRAYSKTDGGRLYAITDKETDHALDAAAPPHPFAQRRGYKRVWISRGDNVARNPDVLTVFWPGGEEGGPVIQELTGRTTIRALLRMDANTPGALKPKQLANAGCKKARWRDASRGTALKYDR